MNEIFENIKRVKFVFLGTFFLVFTLTYILFMAIDFLPEKPEAELETVPVSEEMAEVEPATEEIDIEENNEVLDQDFVESQETELQDRSSNNTEDMSDPVYVETEEAVLPVSITIDKLGKTIPVLNPNSRTIADLDTALLDGVVRHPDSASLNQVGNVFILGHSSYLPSVFNKNFQAFNGIQNLVWGDTISVYADDSVFKYRVEKVYKAKATDVTVPIAGTQKMLTLATCNSFGSVDDRYIVEAKLVEESAL